MALRGLAGTGTTQKILLSLIPSEVPCFLLSDSPGCDLTLVTCLMFRPGTETKVMKLRTLQRSLAFHLPGVRKKGLGWGGGSPREFLSAPQVTLRGDKLQRAVKSHRHSPTWQVYGSPRGRYTLMNAAGHHFSS